MDFIAKYFVYGILFAGPADRPLFPVQVETDYDAPTIGDQVKRLELVGTDQILIRTDRIANGAFVEDTAEMAGANLFLDAEGYIRAECGNRNFTQDPALPDTVLVESENPFGEPQESRQIYHMHQGRLTFMVEMYSRAIARYSWTDYRYQAPLAVPILARGRGLPRYSAISPVDALGRLQSQGAERTRESHPTWLALPPGFIRELSSR